ncbi:hypothetical protein HIM_06775 [Hirsutella minnesotensis 3608]|uniref:Uncharacterized protein n=1 Tax=Hirsutella minnesotensis 3608 TaxID=1043627 RepID=A0A0F7ZZA5_9HYPO|nr:hypothetical protein HIM_06775 [Hirsutella minnesotensis 3608]
MPSTKDIRRALARVRSALPRERRVDSPRRDIRLGLERITRIVPEKQSWRGVHVAGTNGKGSICALLSGMMKRAGVSHGVFLSPAIPEPHNGILVNGRFINKRMHETEVGAVRNAWSRASASWTFVPGEDPGQLTPFELETAAAFRCFEKMHVKYGIVEVGMGGATDATNAMKNKAITIISKIDLDHQEYLGNTIEEIARVKAGIMQPGVPCVVDHSNPKSVLQVLQRHADAIGTRISRSSDAEDIVNAIERQRYVLEDYELNNLMCAATAFRLLFPNSELEINKVLGRKPNLPGRKEKVRVLEFTGGTREQAVLVDGAHNLLGVQTLAKFVDAKVRQDNKPVTWVMGMSDGANKPFAKMIETLIRPGDNFAFVEFKQGATDPSPAPAELGREIAAELLEDESQIYDGEPSLEPALRWACQKAGEAPVVVTGSLYLIREIYMLPGTDPQWKIGTRRPGPAQLWHYSQLSQERPLTPEEASEFKRARRHNYLSPSKSPVFRPVKSGGGPVALYVSPTIRAEQRSAAHHKKQAGALGVAISGIEADVNRAGAGNAAGLSASLEELKRRRDEHLKAYSQAMARVRGHLVDPNKKHPSYGEIFGSARDQGGKVVSLMREHGIKPKKGQKRPRQEAQDVADEDETPEPTEDESAMTQAEAELWLERSLVKGRRS